jgi:hypothetical protein
VNALVALDAQNVIAATNAHATHVLAEDKKLGEKAIERRAAVSNWMKGQKDFTADELGMVNAETLDAAGITLIEKLMAKANGTMPGHQPSPDPKPEPKTHADRIWPSGLLLHSASKGWLIMAALGTAVNLLDLSTRMDPDGGIAPIAELLSQTNSFNKNMVWKEGNLTTGERVTIRTGLPTIYFRRSMPAFSRPSRPPCRSMKAPA